MVDLGDLPIDHTMEVLFQWDGMTRDSNVFPPRRNMTGWWLTYPSEKYESQLGLFFTIYIYDMEK
jgi:hypothetical protein